MPQVVRAFPVLPGMEDKLRDMARALSGARAQQAAAFYAKFGVSHESWHLQETPHGAWVIAVTAIDEPQTRAAEYAESNDEFDRWFKAMVLEVSGIDPATQPLGPPTEAIFDWPGAGGRARD